MDKSRFLLPVPPNETESSTEITQLLSFRMIAGVFGSPHFASLATWRTAGLRPSRAFQRGINLLSLRTLPAMYGSSTQLLVFFKYRLKMRSGKFHGLTSGIRTMPAFWLLTAGKAGYGSGFLRAASFISLTGRSAQPTQQRMVLARAVSATFSSATMVRSGSRPKAG